VVAFDQREREVDAGGDAGRGEDRPVLEPEVALVTAGVETDVLGIGRDLLAKEDIAEVTAAHPRPGFKEQIIAAFADGFGYRPDSTFGTVNADVLEHLVPGYRHIDFVDVIRNSTWPE
jgi:hypothetical protein